MTNLRPCIDVNNWSQIFSFDTGCICEVLKYQRLTKPILNLKAWISNCIHTEILHVNIHPRPQFNDNLAKSPLKFWHGFLIASLRKPEIWLFNHSQFQTICISKINSWSSYGPYKIFSPTVFLWDRSKVTDEHWTLLPPNDQTLTAFRDNRG